MRVALDDAYVVLASSVPATALLAASDIERVGAAGAAIGALGPRVSDEAIHKLTRARRSAITDAGGSGGGGGGGDGGGGAEAISCGVFFSDIACAPMIALPTSMAAAASAATAAAGSGRGALASLASHVRCFAVGLPAVWATLMPVLHALSDLSSAGLGGVGAALHGNQVVALFARAELACSLGTSLMQCLPDALPLCNTMLAGWTGVTQLAFHGADAGPWAQRSVVTARGTQLWFLPRASLRQQSRRERDSVGTEVPGPVLAEGFSQESVDADGSWVTSAGRDLSGPAAASPAASTTSSVAAEPHRTAAEPAAQTLPPHLRMPAIPAAVRRGVDRLRCQRLVDVTDSQIAITEIPTVFNIQVPVPALQARVESLSGAGVDAPRDLRAAVDAAFQRLRRATNLDAVASSASTSTALEAARFPRAHMTEKVLTRPLRDAPSSLWPRLYVSFSHDGVLRIASNLGEAADEMLSNLVAGD